MSASLSFVVEPGGTPLTPRERVLASVVVLVALAAFGLAIRQAGRPLRRRVDPLVAGAIQTGAVLALTGAATVALIAVWNATGVSDALSAGPRIGVRIGVTIALLLAAVFSARFMSRAIERVAPTGRDAVHGREVVVWLVRASVFVFVGLLTFGIWGIDLGNLLLGAGLLGAVIGLAARPTVGSVIAGFVLLFSRPFVVGDWVRIGEREGVVVDVTTMNTELETVDGERALIPNHRVAELDVINRSERDRIRIGVDLAVSPESDLERTMDVARTTLEGLDEARTAPVPQVTATGLDGSGVALELAFWIADPSAHRAMRARSAAIEALYGAFEREGIDLAAGESEPNEDERGPATDGGGGRP